MAQRSATPSPASEVPVAPAPAAAPLVTFETVRNHPRVKVFVRKADEALAEIGYTEHGERHVGLVAHIAFNTLKRLGYPEREAEPFGTSEIEPDGRQRRVDNRA